MESKLFKHISIFALAFFLQPLTSYGLVITSPKNGDTFKEGDSVKIVAEVNLDSPEDKKVLSVGFNITKGLGNCSEKSIPPRYECNFTIPPGAPRVIKIGAKGTMVEGAIPSQWVTIYVTPSPSVSLLGLKSSTGNAIYFYQLSQNKKIYIKGVYSDNVERDLRLGHTGTTYVSSNEKVVTVNADGLATAVGAGTAKITVRNGDKKLVIDVVVQPKTIDRHYV
jgi:hypothetical protein